MLMKFTPVVDFTNIFEAVFMPIFFQQKIAEPKCNKRKAAQNISVQKS